jgi:hypothetical protein
MVHDGSAAPSGRHDALRPHPDDRAIRVHDLVRYAIAEERIGFDLDAVKFRITRPA